MSLADFLHYGTGPGINAIVGFVMSWAVEWIPGFDETDAKTKRLITMLASFLIPVCFTLALWGIEGMPAGSEMGDSVWNALQAGFLAFFASQAAHARKL